MSFKQVRELRVKASMSQELRVLGALRRPLQSPLADWQLKRMNCPFRTARLAGAQR